MEIKPWPAKQWSKDPERITPPSPKDLMRMRFLILCGLAFLIGFYVWLLQPQHRGDPLLDWMLLAALMLATINLLVEWRYYWSMKAPEFREPGRFYTVDVLTTACPGEPKGMILRTLEAMQKISYPHTSYLCDEGDDSELKAECERLGVIHVTRTKKEHAKAGNINNALRTKCTGEIAIILDPDHEPAPFFIDRVLGYFDDEEVGFVQTIQAYRNQERSQIAHEAAQMQYHFYGPIQMGMNGAGTPQAIGANCAFRRSALDSIGGHSSGLAEDMHTTMQLYGKGWKGLYVPEVLTSGLVPQTLAAFYQQQLKWSCGTYDLFFQIYPKVFNGMTWPQRLHFFFGPVHFMQGWITIFTMLVPVISLLFGGIAWKIKPETFFILVLPLVALVMITRAMAQRYVRHESERGIHLPSGILAIGTWWIFSIGNLCALFRKKIPYVPTPKDDEFEDAWKLSIPNFVAAAICIAAVPYGLVRDLTSYTIIMSSFALCNAIFLLFIAIQGQQKTNRKLAAFLGKLSLLKNALATSKDISLGVIHFVEDVFLAAGRNLPVVMAIFVLAVALGTGLLRNLTKEDSFAMPWMNLVKENKDRGGFYSGLYQPFDLDQLDELPIAVRKAEAQLGQPINIASLYLAWGPESIEKFPEAALESIIETGGIPMITWEPWTSTFGWPHEQGLPLAKDKGIFKSIADGSFDYYVREFADRIRELERPVYIRFGHEMDNPQYPWSPKGGDQPKDFIAAWRRVVSLFHQRGASNVAFVYNPWRGEAIDRYYPGNDYVDWIGITLLNYGQAGRDGKWYDFDSLYGEFDYHLQKYDKPVMLAEFGSTAYGGDPTLWLAEAYRSIQAKYPQIQATVFFDSDCDKNWATDWRPSPETEGIDWSMLDDADCLEAIHGSLASLNSRAAKQTPVPRAEYQASRATQLSGQSGNFELLVDGKPFYIKGVAYNPGHDWRDGEELLTRRMLESDFEEIKSMGANTIRRYSGGIADYNIFNIAAEKDLKVLYGFWLKQDVDYIQDAKLLTQYEEGFLETVKRFRDEEALLGWSIGNEVWGMLKHTYEQPYLTEMRIAYVRFVERLARRIKEIDPHHPVFIVCEHSEELSGAISDYVNFAPSIDIIGINSYYESHFESIVGIVSEFSPDKPYLISEYGPVGYWHGSYSPFSPEGLLDEPTASSKAYMYKDRWENYILPLRGENVGGVAYCWSERLEGSSTWFGLTDSEGRFKPGYYALQNAYTGTLGYSASTKIKKLHIEQRQAGPKDVLQLNLMLESTDNNSYTIKWKVLDNQYRKTDASILQRQDPLSPSIKLPSKPGLYWIHVSLSGENIIADEAAISIEISPATLGGQSLTTATRY